MLVDEAMSLVTIPDVALYIPNSRTVLELPMPEYVYVKIRLSPHMTKSFGAELPPFNVVKSVNIQVDWFVLS